MSASPALGFRGFVSGAVAPVHSINLVTPSGDERPRVCRTAEQGDELAPLHSVTSSAGRQVLRPDLKSF
jgi:hypothetical protein